MTSKLARSATAFALAVAGLTSLSTPALAIAATEEITQEWYNIGRAVGPQEAGAAGVKCPHPTPYIKSFTAAANFNSNAEDARFAKFGNLSVSSDGRTVAGEYYNEQTYKEQAETGRRVSFSVTTTAICSNVRPETPPNPRFAKRAFIPPNSERGVTVSCPKATPRAVGHQDEHDPWLTVTDGPGILDHSAVYAGWSNNEWTVPGYVTLSVDCAP